MCNAGGVSCAAEVPRRAARGVAVRHSAHARPVSHNVMRRSNVLPLRCFIRLRRPYPPVYPSLQFAASQPRHPQRRTHHGRGCALPHRSALPPTASPSVLHLIHRLRTSDRDAITVQAARHALHLAYWTASLASLHPLSAPPTGGGSLTLTGRFSIPADFTCHVACVFGAARGRVRCPAPPAAYAAPPAAHAQHAADASTPDPILDLHNRDLLSATHLPHRPRLQPASRKVCCCNCTGFSVGQRRLCCHCSRVVLCICPH